MTSDADRALLLQLARDAIVAHVGAAPPPAPSLADVCARLGGAFVSLHNRGDLRGCIGHIEANEPLARVVSRCAVAACSTDPRFLAAAGRYLKRLGKELAPLTVERGGPILMAQVENEYGSFGSDHAYMAAVSVARSIDTTVPGPAGQGTSNTRTPGLFLDLHDAALALAFSHDDERAANRVGHRDAAALIAEAASVHVGSALLDKTGGLAL